MTRTISRRDVVRGVAGAAGLSVAAPFISLGRYRLFAGSSQEYSALGGNFQRVLGEIWAA